MVVPLPTWLQARPSPLTFTFSPASTRSLALTLTCSRTHLLSHSIAPALAHHTEARDEPVYLSPATLVIVPATLISHWRQQIRVHVVPHLLRVCVLGAGADLDTHAEVGEKGAGAALGAAVFGALSCSWVCPGTYSCGFIRG